MKLQAEIDGRWSEVEVRREGERVFARVDDRDYELEISEPETGVFLLKLNGHIYDAFTERLGEPSGAFEVSIRGEKFEVRLIDPKRLRGSATEQTHGDGLVEIKTAMPGKVVRIIASVGETIGKGSAVIVVEAMKMQNEVRSPKDGKVTEIRVKEGSTVNGGEVLMVIE